MCTQTGFTGRGRAGAASEHLALTLFEATIHKLESALATWPVVLPLRRVVLECAWSTAEPFRLGQPCRITGPS